MRILVVNAGSSSVKLRLLDAEDRVVASADLPRGEATEDREGLGSFIRHAGAIDAVGHRIVHGGPDLRESVVVTAPSMDRLRAVSELAPLHNPPALAALEEARRLLPGAPQVACFDTAFHATIPEAAAIYGLPWGWTEDWGIRRYGFHGLSHGYAARRTAELLGVKPRDLRVVTCHLGAGASLAAVEAGRSVDTTMGFTPLEGLVMATRSGSVDPGALLWIQRRGVPADELERTLDRASGLLGVSGVSSDMRVLLEAADAGHPRARLAVAVYLHRLRAGIAAMAASMGGLDALAFTGGVGEGSARIRAQACQGLGFLGVALDPARNEVSDAGDRDLSSPGARVRAVVVLAREDLEIAREVRRLLA
ncbi:MAG TPA: acetate/propionate family kinase [Actinomycetota bacterium]|nr:acetate/propionate family kinase [Actinomycetota bacterium]